METATSFADLATMHPELEWNEIAVAAVAVLEERGFEAPFQLHIDAAGVPGFGSETLQFSIARDGIHAPQVERIRRTYDAPRRIELAAIAVAGLALYHGGGHEIVDVAVRGSSADYLVGLSSNVLEIAGRSRRSDFATAWQQKKERLEARSARSFYLCVVEFETPAGRLEFFE